MSRATHLRIMLQMTMGPANPTPPSDFTCFFSGPLDDFLLYSGREQSQLLIDIAHDICDPALPHCKYGMRQERRGEISTLLAL